MTKTHDRGAEWMINPPTFSLAETADLMGISRSTLERALKNGCPFVERADRDKRQEWKLRIGDVMDWMLDEKRKKLEAKLRARHGLTDDDDGSRKRAAEALRAELLAEEEEGRLIDVEKVRRQIDDLFDQIRAKLGSGAAAKECRRLIDGFELGADQ
jgi:hypothetical protein